MAATQYVTPALGDEQYTQKIPSNFGETYAAGIGAAGKSISDAITAIGGQYQQNRDIDDTLKAMNQGKILSDDEYNAVAGKSLGAKQTMLGMYAGQWIADQAQNRAVALQKGQYTGQIDVDKAKMDQMIQMIQKGYGYAAGVNPEKAPMGGSGAGGSGAGGSGAGGSGAGGSGNTNTTVGPVVPVVQQPQQPVVGPTAPQNMVLKPGVKFGQMVGPNGKVIKGWTMPDGSFRPMP